MIAGAMNSLPRFVALGESLTDLIQEAPHRWLSIAGGSGWNVARAVARLGVSSAFAGAISRDLFGDEIAALTVEAGLDSRFLQRIDAAPLLAVVHSRHPPCYFFVGEKSADLFFEPGQLPAGWRAAADAVQLGGISLGREPLAQRLVDEARAARAAGKLVFFDPNYREPVHGALHGAPYQSVFRTMAGLATHIKISDEDLAALFPGRSSAAALAELRVAAPEAQVLLTRGAQGMTLIDANVSVDQPAYRVEVADTVGCGDAALGGWIASTLVHGQSATARHLSWAAAAAALAATRAGPYAPDLSEVRSLLDRNGQ